MERKPFDFQKVKVIIKRGKLGDKDIFLDKKWTLENIEHFRPVIDGVTDEEGIEITLTCNLEAFEFIIKFLQETDYEKRSELVNEINHENVLNILVTADFLKLDNIYEMAWHDYFLPKFNSIIDECQLDLTTISPRVTQDVAERMPLENLLLLKDRNDKFVSNIFRHRIDVMLSKIQFHQCRVCYRLLTEEQAELISCTGFRGTEESKDPPESESYYSPNGAWFTRHVLGETHVDKVALMRFLRDKKRICWMEIYLKVYASSEPPLLCALCGQYYTLSMSGLCHYHPEASVYDRLRGIR